MGNFKETNYIHGGNDDRARHYGSLTPPIYQSSTFAFESAEIGEARFNGKDPGYVYTRMGNPTIHELEARMALAEQTEAGLAFSSGMAAISAVLLTHLQSGNHILVSDGIYGATYGLLKEISSRYQISSDYIDFDDPEKVRQAIKTNTRMLLIETPINPTMKMTDIKQTARIAEEKQVLLVVDNTFATPYLQRPMELGADLVVHSATKYISGHGDVIAGIVVGTEKNMKDIRSFAQKNIGSVLGPFEAWLLLRGMKTLAVRMDRHCSNALKIAKRLKKHRNVQQVIYPESEDFSQYELAKKQMDKSGAMISFHVIGTKEEAFSFLNQLKLIPLAVSLGDAETLIEHPASMTHAGIDEQDRIRMGITDTLIRLSVGLEHYSDIWADLKQALNSLHQ